MIFIGISLKQIKWTFLEVESPTLRLVPRSSCFSVDKEVLALNFILGSGFASKMVDCRESDSYEEDSLWQKVRYSNNDEGNLKDLTFIGYHYCPGKQDIVPIVKFDMSKLSITKLKDYNVKILYNNKPLFVGIKALFVLVKKGKDFTRNRYIKIKNPLASTRLWDYFCKIYSETCYQTHLLAFFADPMKVLLECDKLLPPNVLMHFEECVIFFDKEIIKAFGNYYFTDCKVVQSKDFILLNASFLIYQLSCCSKMIHSARKSWSWFGWRHSFDGC